MPNLLKETLNELQENNKTERDVLFCIHEGYFSFKTFKEIADFEYDSGYGGQEIVNMFIVGDGWWLERGEYDGSEWWDFKECPAKPLEENHSPHISYQQKVIV